MATLTKAVPFHLIRSLVAADVIVTSLKSLKGINSLVDALTQAEPLYLRMLPLAADVIVTSLNPVRAINSLNVTFYNEFRSPVALTGVTTFLLIFSTTLLKC